MAAGYPATGRQHGIGPLDRAEESTDRMEDGVDEWFAIPGWGLVFAAWALTGVVGVLVVAVAALSAWHGRRKRRTGGGQD